MNEDIFQTKQNSQKNSDPNMLQQNSLSKE